MVQHILGHLDEDDVEGALDLFGRLHPADQAEVVAAISDNSKAVLLASVDPAVTARVLEHLEPEQAAQALGSLRGPELVDVLGRASPDVAADVIKQMPIEQSAEVLAAMGETDDVVALLRYPDESAGGLMTTDFPQVRSDITTGNALDVLRIQGSIVEHIGSIYVVDRADKLMGSLSVTRLALARPNSIIADIMDGETISVPVTADQEECARLVDRYDLKYLPVVVQNNTLVGLILVEDLVDVLREEDTEDMYRISGLGQDRLFDPLRSSISRRLPWLCINLGTTILAALVISLFESTIEKLVILAAFLPVIAGQGGIGGTQTLTLVVRGLALGEIYGDRGRRLLLREMLLGVIHGVLLGVLIGFIGYVWKGNAMLGLILGLAMLGNMVVAGLTGAGVPLLLRRFGMDPAVSSAVFVTTVTDILGFLLFLGLAAAFYRRPPLTSTPTSPFPLDRGRLEPALVKTGDGGEPRAQQLSLPQGRFANRPSPSVSSRMRGPIFIPLPLSVTPSEEDLFITVIPAPEPESRGGDLGLNPLLFCPI